MNQKALAASLLMAASLALSASPGHAQVVHAGPAASPIAEIVTVPAGSKLFYLSGVLPAVADPKAPPGTPAAYGDTTTQAISCFKKIQATLAAQGLTLGDVVMMRIYMVGDPTKGGHMDFMGMMAGYKQFFGSADQPNKPSRSTVQVAGLAAPGPAMEIEVQAAKAP